MIAITGATGHLGRAVTTALMTHVSPAAIALGAREPSKLADEAKRGCRVVKADYDQPEHLDALFAGASVALLISGTAANDIRIQQHRNAIDAAKRAGVERVVYTSFANPSVHSLF